MPDLTLKILIVDDSPDTLEILSRNLSDNGYKTYISSNVPDAIRMLESETIDLVVTDLKMPKVSGLDLVRHVKSNYPDTEVMMITGYATVDGAVDAVKSGAEEYLTKPFTEEELLSAVQRVMDKLRRQRAHNVGTSTHLPQHGIVGESKKIVKILREIEKASRTSATVLITGESGTGKELVARAIHYHSNCATAPFVPVNCGGIPENLLESELFGHVKGAFTGASDSRAGFFQTADGGTIFLDEIAETTSSMQVKLLRVLQDKEICMIGTSRTRKIDVRIIAATNKNLQELVHKNAFRDDLFYRLNVITIEVPPLRERGEDIYLLVSYFTEKFSKEYGNDLPKYSDDTLQLLGNYSWPGNVRELENLVQKVVIMTGGDEIRPADLPVPMRFSAPKNSILNRTLAEVEIDYIRNVLNYTKGNKTKAAGILGIDRKTLREKLKRYDIFD
jgi:DNA-binding NtrC family response regulator